MEPGITAESTAAAAEEARVRQEAEAKARAEAEQRLKALETRLQREVQHEARAGD